MYYIATWTLFRQRVEIGSASEYSPISIFRIAETSYSRSGLQISQGNSLRSFARFWSVDENKCEK